MHKPESVVENETHKILWILGIQTDPPMPVRKPDIEFGRRKKNLLSRGFCCYGRRRNARKWIDKRVFGSCQNAEKAIEHEGYVDINCSWGHWNNSQGPGKDRRGKEIRKRIEIIQNTALIRSVRILKRVLETQKRLAVSQTSIKKNIR